VAALSPRPSNEPARFTFLPFQPSTATPLPWDSISTAINTPLFRLKKVASWAAKPGRREIDHRDEAIEKGSLLVLQNPDGIQEPPSREYIPLEEYINGLRATKEETSSSSSRTITTVT